jgi:AhpD family alkylhydroperoxidase
MRTQCNFFNKPESRERKIRIMDKKIKELIAVGASVAAHCRPCLQFHVDKAMELGIGKDEIAKAVAVGKMVQNGGDGCHAQVCR